MRVFAGCARDWLIPGLHDAGAPLASQMQSPASFFANDSVSAAGSRHKPPVVMMLFWQISQAAQASMCMAWPLL